MKIFVFGSNLAGRHGAGAALEARRKYGAVYGCGEGLSGYAYGIPTKDRELKPRTLDEIRASVETFLDFARDTPETIYQVTRIGCGLAGYRDEQIGPMFADAPPNCELPVNWERYRVRLLDDEDETNARAAIQAASAARRYEVAVEIAARTGLLDKICVGCAGPAEGTPRLAFEQRDAGMKISTCEYCTEPFAQWVAAGGLQPQLSKEVIRAGILDLQRQINSLGWKHRQLRNRAGQKMVTVDGIIGPATLSALQKISDLRSQR